MLLINCYTGYAIPVSQDTQSIMAYYSDCTVRASLPLIEVND